jgi:uncharacterized protein YeaO (DUF488 family)
MPVLTKRWNEPPDPDDGLRVLVCRLWPRGVRKQDAPWDLWLPALGPSRGLLARARGWRGPPLAPGEFRRRYLAEMKAQAELIDRLARVAAGGQALTLLCSRSCADPARCHRSLLARLLEARGAALAKGGAG